MKTTKKPKVTRTQPSIVQVVPNDLAKREFVQAVGKPAEGDNSYIESFLLVMDLIASIARPFCLSDVVAYSKKIRNSIS